MNRDRLRAWATNVRQQLLTVIGVDPVAQGYVNAIDQQVNRGLQGLSGTILRGNSGDPVYRWNGYVDYGLLAQSLAIPASTNLRNSPNVAMPATAGPLVVTTTSPVNAVMASLAAQPPGFR